MTAAPTTQQGLSGGVQVETSEAGKDAISALVLPQNPRRWLLLEADLQSPPELHIVQIRPGVLTAAEVEAVTILQGDGWRQHRGYDGLALMKQGTLVQESTAPSTDAQTGCERHTDCTRARLAQADQQLAETTRLLRELSDTARDLDAWTSARHAEVLRKVEAHLARTGA